MQDRNFAKSRCAVVKQSIRSVDKAPLDLGCNRRGIAICMQHRIQDAATAKKRNAIPVTVQLGKEVWSIENTGRGLRGAHHHRADDFELFHRGGAAFHRLAEHFLTPADDMHVNIDVCHWRSSSRSLCRGDTAGSLPGRRMTWAERLLQGFNCKRRAETGEQISAGNDAL